ncbi:MAG: hypothetical protein ACRETU_07430 [Steroidobacterales bacterium]
MNDAAQKKRIRRSAFTWTLVALAFFLGFIALTVYRAKSHV